MMLVQTAETSTSNTSNTDTKENKTKAVDFVENSNSCVLEKLVTCIAELKTLTIHQARPIAEILFENGEREYAFMILLNLTNKCIKESQYKLGKAYENGNSVDRDYHKAYECYVIAAEKQHSHAMIRLGRLCEKGLIKNRRDYEQAYSWYSSAAELSSSAGAYQLGLLYEKGHFVMKNCDKALSWYEKAIKHNKHVKATFRAARIYENIDNWPYRKPNYTKAIVYYRRAAESNHSMALNNLGCLYGLGQGVEKNHDRAFDYYKSSASFGNALAFRNMAACFILGIGMDANIDVGLRYLEKAQKQGLREAKVIIQNLKEVLSEEEEAIIMDSQDNSNDNKHKVLDENSASAEALLKLKETLTFENKAMLEKVYRTQLVIRDLSLIK